MSRSAGSDHVAHSIRVTAGAPEVSSVTTGAQRGEGAAAERGRRAAAGCIEAAALFLASEPAAVERALAVHRAGEDGRCVGCGSAGVRWPCAVVSGARRGLELLRDH